MKSKLLSLILLLVIFVGCSEKSVEVTVPIPDEEPEVTKEEIVADKINSGGWDDTRISDAVTWKYHHFTDLFSSNQSITIIEVNLQKNPELDISYVTSGFLRTSEAAKNEAAVAAVNGSFFDTGAGGSTVFFKKDGEIINYTRDGFDSFRENSGFAVTKAGNVSVVKRPTAGWETTEAENLLVSGPLLVYDGEVVSQLPENFNSTRHPRTAVCVTENNHLLATVVDGRSTKARGMTTEELALVMKVLDCEEAMNMDGGGSSTAWAKNHGEVNYPSDNGQFDHKGER